MKYKVDLKRALVEYSSRTGERMTQKRLAGILFPEWTPNASSVFLSQVSAGRPVDKELADRIRKTLKCSAECIQRL